MASPSFAYGLGARPQTYDHEGRFGGERREGADSGGVDLVAVVAGRDEGHRGRPPSEGLAEALSGDRGLACGTPVVEMGRRLSIGSMNPRGEDSSETRLPRLARRRYPHRNT